MRPTHNRPRLMGKSLIQRRSKQTEVCSLGLLVGVAVPLALFAPQPLASGVAEAQVALEEYEPEPERLLYLSPEAELYQGESIQETPKLWHPARSLTKHRPVSPVGLKQAADDNILLHIDGTLTDDNATLDDGSRYDAHVFHGQAGQIVKITLESDEFDTYLLLEDALGERIAENDDGGSGTNSEMVVQLPSDGHYHILANAYAEAGRGDYRLTILSSTVEELQMAQDRFQADLLRQQGIEQYRTSQWDEALESWQQALVIYRDISNRVSEADILGKIAIVYSSQGYYTQALDYYWQSLNLKREIGDRAGESDTLGNIGSTYALTGDYTQSLAYYQQSLNISRQIGNQVAEANALSNIGSVYRFLGSNAQALSYYEQALNLKREIGDQFGEARTLGNIGVAYQFLGDYAQALNYYKQSLDLKREIGDRDGEADTLSNIGNVYDYLGNYKQALHYHMQSLVITREIGDRGDEAIILGNIGNVYQSVGDYPQALDTYEQSLALSREIGDRAGEARTLGNIGSLLETQEQPELAIVFLKQSINQYERIRESIRSLESELQESYTGTVEGTYRQLADLLIQEGRILEAQRVLDLLKLEEVREFTRTTRAEWTTDGIRLSPLEQEIATAYEGLIALGQKIYSCEQGDCPAAELDGYYRDQERLVAAYNQKVTEFEQTVRDNRYDDDFFYNPDNLADSARDIVESPGTMLIYPFVLEDKLWLLWTTTGGIVGKVQVDVTQSELGETVRQFREQLQQPGAVPLADLQATSTRLYNWLIKPLEGDLQRHDVTNLVFAQDRVTRYIPMAALYDGSQYLIETYTLSTILSAEWTDTRDQLTTVDDSPVLGLGLSQQVPGFSALPNVFDEIHTIIREADDPGIYPGQVFMDEEFDFDALRQNARNHRVLHIATHAKFEPGALENSFLVLGNGEPLRISEIETIGRQLRDVHLVVLSACETALGGQGADGREIAGLSAYFLAPNRAKSVLASLWQVADDSTRLLMQEFYTDLAEETLSKAEALRQVQMSFIQNPAEMEGLIQRGGFELEGVSQESVSLSHPYYWAPFILIGNRL